jgi:hypothetical protein
MRQKVSEEFILHKSPGNIDFGVKGRIG